MVFLVSLAVIVVLAALLYAAGRGYIAAVAGVAELRAILAHVHADTQEIDRSLCQQPHVL